MHRTDPDAGFAGVDPRGANLDHDLARAGRRHVDVRHIQHLTAAVTVEPYGARPRKPGSRHLVLLPQSNLAPPRASIGGQPRTGTALLRDQPISAVALDAPRRLEGVPMELVRVTVAGWAAATLAVGAVSTGCSSWQLQDLVAVVFGGFIERLGHSDEPVAAQPADYSSLLIKASDIGGDLSAPQPPVLNPNGAAGVAQLFANTDNSRRIRDTILIVADPATAAAGLDNTKTNYAGKVSGSWQPVDVGSNGALISGTSPDNSRAISVLLFTEGKALVKLEFDSAPNDPIDADVAKDIGRKQDAAVKKRATQLAEPGARPDPATAGRTRTCRPGPPTDANVFIRTNFGRTQRLFFGLWPPSGQATTSMGSPTLTLLKYHAALSGLRLMHPWLTLALPCESTDHGAECT